MTTSTSTSTDNRARAAWLLSVCVPSRLLSAAVDGWRPGGAFGEDDKITCQTGRERLLFTVALALARMRVEDDRDERALTYMRLCADAQYVGDGKLYELISAGKRAHLAEVYRAVLLRWRKHQLVPGKLHGGARLRALVYFEGRPKPWIPTVTLGPPADGQRAAEWLHFMRAVDGIKNLEHAKTRWWETRPRQREVLAVIDESDEIRHVMPFREPWRRRVNSGHEERPGATS